MFKENSKVASINFDDDNQVTLKVSKQRSSSERKQPDIFITKDITDMDKDEVEIIVNKIHDNKHWKQRGEYVNKEAITDVITKAKKAIGNDADY